MNRSYCISTPPLVVSDNKHPSSGEPETGKSPGNGRSFIGRGKIPLLAKTQEPEPGISYVGHLPMPVRFRSITRAATRASPGPRPLHPPRLSDLSLLRARIASRLHSLQGSWSRLSPGLNLVTVWGYHILLFGVLLLQERPRTAGYAFATALDLNPSRDSCWGV